MSFFKYLTYWVAAIRPKTLSASIAPVMIATAMAFGDGLWHPVSAGWALFGALMIQIATNLANDYFDQKSGVDALDRQGPVRVTQAGLISPHAVKWGFILAFALAGLACSQLILRVGWPILLIGILSILSGIFYAAGPKPLSHLGLGDLFVLVFFGPVAVVGTYYVQTYEWNGAVVLMGLACGLWSTAILVVNNLRDMTTDERAGKRTLAVRFGLDFTRNEYLFCILAACAIPVLVYVITGQAPRTMLSSSVVFACIPLVNVIYTSREGAALNKVLARTGFTFFIFSILFSLGWIF